MTTYKELHGRSIAPVSSNPSTSGDAGKIFYNSTDNVFRSIVSTEAWSSGGPLSTGRYLSGSLGTQTAGVQIIGSTPSTNLANVEHYNGTGWSEETNYPAAGQAVSGAGTQTAGIAFGGSTPSQTANAFDYNGTAWTAANSLPYTANNIASCGLAKTSVIGAVGRDGSSGNSGTNKTVTFDGTNFANGPNINTTRMFNNSSGAGTGTAALIVGGFIDPSPNAMTNCEEYNGSSWTNTGVLNVATGFASAFGIQTNAVAQTNGSNYVETEGYNGSTWTTLPNMSVSSPGGLYGSSAGSTGDAGWVSSMGPVYNATEEFNRSATIVAGAAWAASGNIPVSIRGGASGGTKDAAFMTGGLKNSPSTDRNDTYLYNGASWTAGNDLPNDYFIGGGVGPSTAGVVWNGIVSGGGPATSTYEFDGTNWTAGGTFPTIGPNGSQGSTGAGVGQTAVVAMGGTGDPPPAQSDRMVAYNGSAWSSDESMPTGVSGCAADGPNTAIWIAGGYTNPDTTSTSSREYDGSSWTNTGSTVIPVPQG